MAHLDYVDLELAELARHRLQLIGLSNPSRVRTKLIAVHIRDGDEAFGSACRTRGASTLTVVLRGAQQVGVRVAEITAEGAAIEKPVQCGSALEAEVHDRSRACRIGHGFRGCGLRSTAG